MSHGLSDEGASMDGSSSHRRLVGNGSIDVRIRIAAAWAATMFVIVASCVGETWLYYFAGSVVKVIVLAALAWSASTWPRQSPGSSAQDHCGSGRRGTGVASHLPQTSRDGWQRCVRMATISTLQRAGMPTGPPKGGLLERRRRVGLAGMGRGMGAPSRGQAMKRAIWRAILALAFGAAAAPVIPVLAQDGAWTASSYDWTGFYAGINGGFAAGTVAIDNTTLPDYSFSLKGATAGIDAGRNWQLDRVVLGIEGDLNYTPFSGDDGDTLGVVDAVKGKFSGSLRGRIGVGIERLLLYATAGVAVQSFTYTETLNGVVDTYNPVHLGPVVGVGGEYAVSDQLSLRLEALFADFGMHDYSPIKLGSQGVVPWRAGLRTAQIRAGLNFHF
jgi:outer membrane immunogenic protein